MYDLICVGSISVDLYFKGENFTNDQKRYHLAIGGKYYADFFYEDIGGGAVNVAVGVARHGLKTAVFGKIGENGFKEMILKKLTDKKVSTKFCEIEDDYYKISSILLNKNGEKTIIHYEKPTHLIRQFFLHKDLKQAKNIYFSPMPHLNLKEKKRMIAYLKGDKTLTFVNFSAVDCHRPITDLIDFFDALDVLIINGYEYSLMIKKPYEKIDFYNLKINLPYLKDRILIITDGEKGSYGYYKNNFYYQEAVKPKKIVDATGCGDAYTAGFIAEYLKSQNIPLSMQKGAEYSAQKISRLGAN
ncbi:MAG: carbohydrate kinase family protein [Patescibacteria group bacterium]|nr:carbohydrate kinase family protein [Patescibacteria group bacterium]